MVAHSRGWAFSTKPCDLRCFPTDKTHTFSASNYRIKPTQLRLELSDKTYTYTNSTDQVVQLNKYVQAGGLLILGFSPD